jgi:oxygen-dependent protoporphyrinogen oxidase
MDGVAHVVVVGGGISGLAAALRVRRLAPDATITVVDGADRLGGKLRTGELAGLTVERGAEAFLLRDPAAAELAAEVGLGELAHPARVGAGLAVGGTLHPMPTGTLMGIPADPAALAATGLATPTPEPPTAGPLLTDDTDVSVGHLVRSRLGDEVTDRLVDPLLGGVYAGRADNLSLQTTIPTLYAAAHHHPTLTTATHHALHPTPDTPHTAPAAGVPGAGSAAASTAPASGPGAPGVGPGAVGGGAGRPPMFGTVVGGMSRLVAAVAAASGAVVRLGLPVRELAPVAGGGWRLVVGETRRPEVLTADAVVLAVPARPAARLLAGVAPAAAAEIGALDYASVALVTLALPGLPGSPGGAGGPLPASSGFLVPATERSPLAVSPGGRYAVKAATFVTTKWPHLAAGAGTDGTGGTARAGGAVALVRASLGRYGDTRVLQRDDGELVELVRAELAGLLGRPLPVPVETSVTRWGGGLPQYAPGHAGRVGSARRALAGHPTLALAGAAYDGVGIPACVRSGQAAATAITRSLALSQGERR